MRREDWTFREAAVRLSEDAELCSGFQLECVGNYIVPYRIPGPLRHGVQAHERDRAAHVRKVGKRNFCGFFVFFHISASYALDDSDRALRILLTPIEVNLEQRLQGSICMGDDPRAQQRSDLRHSLCPTVGAK